MPFVFSSLSATPGMQFGGLSQELSDAILDMLYDDFSALKACSLTCRSWLPRCRKHLHRRVTLRPEYDEDVAQSVTDSPYAGVITVNSTLYSSPDVARCVQELRIMSLPPPWEGDSFEPTHFEKRHETVRGFCQYVWQILSRLQDLRILHLMYFEWRYSLAEKHRFAALARSVTYLKLYNTLFENRQHFLSLLAMFPRLDGVLLSGVNWILDEMDIASLNAMRRAPTSAEPPRLSFPIHESNIMLHHLHSLTFVDAGCNPSTMADLALWLSANKGTLRYGIQLRLLYLCNAGLQGPAAVLHSLGPSLQYLELMLAHNMDQVRDNPMLGCCTGLQTLVLHVVCSPPLEDHLHFDHALEHLLTELRSTCLESLELRCYTKPAILSEAELNVHSFTLKRIGELVSTPPFAGLSSLVFSFSFMFQQYKGDIVRIVHRDLKDATSRGIAKLTWWTHHSKY